MEIINCLAEQIHDFFKDNIKVFIHFNAKLNYRHIK